MRAVLAAVALVAWSAGWPAARYAAGQDTAELPIRAAFVYNFTKFIEWPKGALPADQFRICVVGDARFARALDELIAGETLQGRPLVRIEPSTPEAARGCQILYVGRQQGERGDRMLEAVRQLPVLTVGDPPRFLQEGGAVRFLVEQNRVRFDVNLQAVKRAGLNMDSKLLRVARRVEGAR